MKKFTCYDCIHCGACSDAGDSGYSYLKEDVSKCKHFKNKADFVEAKHGYWKHTIEVGHVMKHHYWNCSLCGVMSQNDGEEKYCRECGAIMGESEDKQND